MKTRLNFTSIFIYILIFAISSFIVLASVSCCFTGQSKTTESESAVTQNSTTENDTEITAAQKDPSVKNTEPVQTAEESNSKNELSDLIIVEIPAPGQTVSSPLTITGKARGTWYFEADFPIYLLDANGNIIASHYGQAQGEWMTEDFVPFIAEIIFENPATETGTLVLEKDNPSGLAENDAKIEIPVRFEANAAD